LGVVLWIDVATFCALPGAITWTYSRSDPVDRRRTRWIVLGFYLGLVPNLALRASMGADILDPTLALPLFELAGLAMTAIPISVGIAIVRFNYLDIDRLISATAAYSTVVALFVVLGLAGVPRLAAYASEVAGIEPAAGQLALALAIGALVIPAHRRLRPQIDGLFFPERQALQEGVDLLIRRLPECAGPDVLLERVGDTLNGLLQAESCVVYTRSGEQYRAILARGGLVPLTFEADSALIAALRESTTPLATEGAGGSSFDRAVLDTLRASVVLPIQHRRQTLVAFVCLGAKRSGDVYTSTDLALLRLVAERSASELGRWDEGEAPG
jgi:hypothetical protein